MLKTVETSVQKYIPCVDTIMFYKHVHFKFKLDCVWILEGMRETSLAWAVISYCSFLCFSFSLLQNLIEFDIQILHVYGTSAPQYIYLYIFVRFFGTSTQGFHGVFAYKSGFYWIYFVHT